MTADFEELHGKKAKDFANTHLQKVSVNYDRWEVEYRDPETGQRYLMDYLHPEGGGIPRLRPVAVMQSEE